MQIIPNGLRASYLYSPKNDIMKAIAKIERLNSDMCKLIIVRNLSRIMNIRILNIDIENKTLSFAYENMAVIDKVKRELWRIGYPIEQLIRKVPKTELVF
jgi:hypothetical protein